MLPFIVMSFLFLQYLGLLSRTGSHAVFHHHRVGFLFRCFLPSFDVIYLSITDFWALLLIRDSDCFSIFSFNNPLSVMFRQPPLQLPRPWLQKPPWLYPPLSASRSDKKNTTTLSALIRHSVIIGNKRFRFCFRSADNSAIISSRIRQEERNNSNSILGINLLARGYWQQTFPFPLLLIRCAFDGLLLDS